MGSKSRRKSEGALERGKSMTAVAGDAIGGAAIAATRLVIRKASAAVRSADRALYGRTPKRKRAAATPTAKRRTPKRRANVRTGAKATRAAAARLRPRSRTMSKKRRSRKARSKRRG